MTAETLRRAAALMRERAQAATPGPWHASGPFAGTLTIRGNGNRNHVAGVESQDLRADAEHIASWHPAVALAVADWLDAMATRGEKKIERGGNWTAVWAHEQHALNVARAYLGESA